jgi:outer membrane lipase/esterase
MKLKSSLMRVPFLAVVAAGMLSSCGGGTQIEAFSPTRIISFGDEASVVNADGSKYTVNALVFDSTVTPSVPATPHVLECASNRTWNQVVAGEFGLAFAGRCAGTNTAANGVLMAANGATVAGLVAQVDSFLGGDTFSEHDLVTVMVGVNDIIDAAQNAADPVAAVEAAGTAVGAQVVRITDRGAKVIVATVPDVGLTPYAAALEANLPGSAAALSTLTTRFNTRLRLKLQDVRDGGHAVGLVLADELVLTMVRFPAVYGLNNITGAVCSVALPACDMTTLVSTATATNYGNDWLWADDRHLAPNAQGRIGALAATRARSNPF